MSGFFGILREDGKPVDEQFLGKIAAALSSRGADGTSTWTREGIGGCFALMRTGPAPQAESQPVVLDERLWLWGDVRLDGREELQEQLGTEKSARLNQEASESLLLKAWEKWGVGALQRLIGDFSFALWDGPERTLWCARDFIGPNPFYYAHVNGVFCFGNTLEALLQTPEISAALDEVFIGDFLLDGSSLEPSATVYRDIRRLPAGHVLKFAARSTEIRRFRKLPIEEPLRLKHEEEYVEGYLDLLRTAIRDRLPAGPTALYLSGGLDSSSVCAVTAQMAKGQRRKPNLKAFTLSWEPFVEDLESPLAKVTAEHLGIRHEILCEPGARFFEGANFQETRTPEPLPHMLFKAEQNMYRRIAAHSNVVLSGDGGDDILVGQSWPYLRDLWQRGNWGQIVRDFGGFLWSHRRLPPLRGGFRARISPFLNPQDALAEFPGWLNEAFCSRLNLRQRWSALKNRKKDFEHPLHPLAYASLHSGYWAEVLETEGAGWTQVNLESRAPLLDLRVLTFLLRLPPVPWCVDKELCRRAMRDLLPAAVLERPKTAMPDILENLGNHPEWLTCSPKDLPSSKIEPFVNWDKWCETLFGPQGYPREGNLRPLSLLFWLLAR